MKSLVYRISEMIDGASDPNAGVMRHADAGYARAIAVAGERGVRIPMLERVDGAP